MMSLPNFSNENDLLYTYALMCIHRIAFTRKKYLQTRYDLNGRDNLSRTSHLTFFLKIG